MKYFGWIDGIYDILFYSEEMFELKISDISGVFGCSIIYKLSIFFAPFVWIIGSWVFLWIRVSIWDFLY